MEEEVNEIEPFWAGAMLHGRSDEIDVLFARGFTAQTIGPRELASLNVEPARAKRWLETPAMTTLGEVIPCVDPRYPMRLRHISDRPAVLLVEGDVSCLTMTPAVAIVGTRSCTAYGRSVARTLGRGLAAAGGLVVSGLARGVDAYAHAGAMEAGRTLAVLGHGLAFTSPASNRRLRQDMVERGGLVVSTWPDAMEATRWTFPKRNRWIAGLSQHVVVVEAPVRSGALITAEEALSVADPSLEHSPVWAVPGPIGTPASAGCLKLLSEGARVVVSVEAMVAEIFGLGAQPKVAEPNDLWIARLCAGASLDAIARMRGLSTVELVREVTRLELEGVLVRLPGQRYARSGPARETPAHE